MNEKALQPIPERPSDWDALEDYIKRLFKAHLYLPLIEEIELNRDILQNALDDLNEAIVSGKIVHDNGVFTGRFTAKTSKELKSLGAKWSPAKQGWRIRLLDLPPETQSAVRASEARILKKLQAIDKIIAKILPEEIADHFKAEKLFDTTLWKVEKEFQKSVKGIAISQTLTKVERARIAKEYTQNLRLYIRDFTREQTVKLRKDVLKAALKGNRYEGLVTAIQRNYEVSQNKAKFLARQETSLMMTTFKQARYQDAGVNDYEWRCVHRAHDQTPHQHTPGNVRYYHGILNGKRFKFSQPPVVDKNGGRKNPGQDYNCRCVAVPIVKF